MNKNAYNVNNNNKNEINKITVLSWSFQGIVVRGEHQASSFYSFEIAIVVQLTLSVNKAYRICRVSFGWFFPKRGRRHLNSLVLPTSNRSSAPIRSQPMLPTLPGWWATLRLLEAPGGHFQLHDRRLEEGM